MSLDLDLLQVPVGMPQPTFEADAWLANLHPKLTEDQNSCVGSTIVIFHWSVF